MPLGPSEQRSDTPSLGFNRITQEAVLGVEDREKGSYFQVHDVPTLAPLDFLFPLSLTDEIERVN